MSELQHSLPTPAFGCTLLVRTDYSDNQAWERMVNAVQTPSEEGFTAFLTIADNPTWDGADQERLIAALPDGYKQRLLIVSDLYAQTGPGFPLLVIDLRHQQRRSMRCAAHALWDVENNLSTANMDWEDYANHTDPDGVFRDSELALRPSNGRKRP